MADPRMTKLNTFTSQIHGKDIPSNLRIDGTLPSGFTVLILGASEGIGEHIAIQYGAVSATRIILTARRREILEETRNRLQRSVASGTTVDIATCDISSASSIEELAAHAQSLTGGRLDCVIVNAAYAPPITLKTHLDQPADVQRAFDVNAIGTFHAAHFFIPMLLASEAGQGAKQFIAIGSMASQIRRGIIANMGYCVSKMAQQRMIEYIAEQYADQGLWTVAVHPGAVNTSMAKGNTPEAFIPYLTDDVALCGHFCVWLSRNVMAEKLSWLNGRFVSATWDVDELVSKEREIVGSDLLKFTIALD